MHFQIRERYEAYVIYNFMMFLVTFMYEQYNVEQILTYKPAQPQLFPFQKLPPWPKVTFSSFQSRINKFFWHFIAIIDFNGDHTVITGNFLLVMLMDSN